MNATDPPGSATSTAAGADDEPFPHPTLLAAAAALRRLGNAMSAGHLDHELAARLAATVNGLADEAERMPPRDKQVENSRSPRYSALVAGHMPDPTPDGTDIDFDPYSLIGGPLNGFGLAGTHRRDGDEAVCTVTFGAAYEGPPGRVHGGAVALVVDEATATTLPMMGRFGFTGSVSLRLTAPAPLGVEVEFRSSIVGEEGRKLFVRCTGRGPEGVFVEAEAIYIQVDPGTLPWVIAARAAIAAGVGQAAPSVECVE